MQGFGALAYRSPRRKAPFRSGLLFVRARPMSVSETPTQRVHSPDYVDLCVDRRTMLSNGGGYENLRKLRAN